MTVRRAAIALVCLLALAANARSLANGFAMDDEFVVLRNPSVHGIERLGEAVSTPYWPGTVGRLAMYRPLTSATLAVQWELWESRPLGYHAVNVLLHAAISGLVFLLLTGLGLATTPALAGAAVFAVHPVHTEAVASVVGLGELLAAGLVLLAACLYVRDGRGWRYGLAIGLLYLAALGAKEIAATLPGLLLVLEAGRPGQGAGGVAVGPAAGGPDQRGWRGWLARVWARWPVYAATGAALVVYGVLRTRVLGTTVGSLEAPYLAELGWVERWLTAVSVWPEYLRLMLFPVDLVADYSPGVLMAVTEPGVRFVAGVLVGAVALVVVVAAWSPARLVSLGVLWFGMAVLPVSNLVVAIDVLLAERTLYLPSVGWALTAGGVVGWIWTHRRAWRAATAGALALVVLLAGARTWGRTSAWRSTETVISTLIRDHPESFRAQWIAADRLRQQGRLDAALERYALAVDLLPGHYQLQIEYGLTLLEAGDPEAAAGSFATALERVPDLPDAHVLLMVALLAADRPADAIDAGRRALRLIPEHRGVHHQLAIALARTGAYEDALDARRRSIRLGGERAGWRQFLHEAELLLRIGRADAADAALARARDRAPAAADVPSLDALRQAVDTADLAVLPYR